MVVKYKPNKSHGFLGTSGDPITRWDVDGV